MHKTIRHFFPRLFEQFNSLDDGRKRSSYEVSELLTAWIAMFLLRETSRNAINNDRKEAHFKQNYFKVFGQRLPHMDTVEDLLRLLQGDVLPLNVAIAMQGILAGCLSRKWGLRRMSGGGSLLGELELIQIFL